MKLYTISLFIVFSVFLVFAKEDSLAVKLQKYYTENGFSVYGEVLEKFSPVETAVGDFFRFAVKGSGSGKTYTCQVGKVEFFKEDWDNIYYSMFPGDSVFVSGTFEKDSVFVLFEIKTKDKEYYKLKK